MKKQHKNLSCLIILTALLWFFSSSALAVIKKGDDAPTFSLPDTTNRTFDLKNQFDDHQLIVLYFFDIASSSSHDGLLMLDRLLKKYDGLDVLVWGITRSGKDDAGSFVNKITPGFPVLLDGGDVSNLYGVKNILPTVCILGPQGKVINFIQGGGKTAEILLTRLAERTLQRKKAELAVAVSEEAMKQNPRNTEAQAIQGYALAAAGQPDQALKTFDQLAKSESQEAAVVGKEGLSAVYAQQGDTGKALELVEEIVAAAPQRVQAHVVKGNILYSQGKVEEAKKEFSAAVSKADQTEFQQALAFNQLGRVKAGEEKYQEARDLYEKALEIDPYYVEATSNKGVSFEKEGQWQEALNSYKQASSLDKHDFFVATLAKNAAKMLSNQADFARKKRTDQLIDELVESYKNNQSAIKPPLDDWTSPPMILSFVTIEEKGALTERDGVSEVMMAQLSELLNLSGRVQVVERAILDQLLAELKLGSSELANPETVLRLGRIFASRLVTTGSLINLHDRSLLSLRLIDTETTRIAKVLTRDIPAGAAYDQELYQLNRDILKMVIQQYPLRGYIVKADADEILINLGSNHGVVVGTAFDVVTEAEPIEYKGKVIQGGRTAVGRIEVVRVEPDHCFARVVERKNAFQRDAKVIEVSEIGGAK